MALAYYKILATGNDFVQKILELQNRIEPVTRAENAAAIKLQSAWRRHKTWSLLKHWQNAAKTIQRYWKGSLARKRVRQMRAYREEMKLLAAINHNATMIQSAWRGYLVRAKVLDFYQRKMKIQAICAANEKIQAEIQAIHEKHQSETQARIQYDLLVQAETNLQRMHCQISTQAHPGVHAKNQRLEEAIKEYNRRTLRSDPKTLRPLHSAINQN